MASLWECHRGETYVRTASTVLEPDLERIDGLMDLIIVQLLQALGTLLSETKCIYKTYSSSTFEYDRLSHFLSCCKILYKHITVTSLYHYVSVLLVNQSAEELHYLVEELLFVINRLLNCIFAVFIYETSFQVYVVTIL